MLIATVTWATSSPMAPRRGGAGSASTQWHWYWTRTKPLSGSEPMTGRPHNAKAAGTVLAAVMAFGCGGTAQAPSAGDFEGFIPDLRGRRVMVFRCNSRRVCPEAWTRRSLLRFGTRGPEVAWIFSDELEAVVARSPSVDTAVRGLPVGIFLSAEVRRIGDPLFGQLRRLGA